MARFFINPETGIVRAGWRILLFIALMVGLAAGLMYGVSAIFGEFKEDSNLQLYLLTIAVTIAVFIARKYLDKKNMTMLGLKLNKAALLDFMIGTTIGAVALAGIFFTMLLTGQIEFHGFLWWADSIEASGDIQMAVVGPLVLAAVFRYISTSWWEELIFRGYFLQNIADGLGILWAVGITSLFFGVLHYLSPSATILSTLLIAIVTPMFIYGYLKTGQLWLPVGLHFGWNFFQTSIFGFSADKQGAPPNLISQSPVGPEWLTGGGFGVEGSIFVIPFAFLVIFAIHYWVRLSRKPDQGFLEFEVYNND